MIDGFAELMAFLFAEERQNNPMPTRHSHRVLSAVQNYILGGSGKNNQKEDDRPDEGQKMLI